MGKKVINNNDDFEIENDSESYFSRLQDEQLRNCLSQISCISNHNKTRKQKREANECSYEQSYLNLPERIIEDNPLDMENIKEKQLLDAKLQEAALKYPNCYSHKNIVLGFYGRFTKYEFNREVSRTS